MLAKVRTASTTSRLPAVVDGARVARERAEVVARERSRPGVEADDLGAEPVERVDRVGVGMRREAEHRGRIARVSARTFVERGVGEEEHDGEGVVAEAGVTATAAGAAEARGHVRADALAGGELVERLHLALRLVHAVAEADGVDRGLDLLELARGAQVEPERIVRRGIAVIAGGEVGEGGDAEARAGDGLVDARRDAIAEALPDLLDLLAHARRGVDEEDDVGVADLGAEDEVGAHGRPIGGHLDARDDARDLDRGIGDRRRREVGARSATEQRGEQARKEASRRGPGREHHATS